MCAGGWDNHTNSIWWGSAVSSPLGHGCMHMCDTWLCILDIRDGGLLRRYFMSVGWSSMLVAVYDKDGFNIDVIVVISCIYYRL